MRLEPYPEYKPSGAEWIGAVPVGWTMTRIGQHFSERSQAVSDTEYAPLSVTMAGIVPQLKNVAKTQNNDARKLVRMGDFAINSRSDRKGSSGISDRDGSVSVITTVITPRQIEPRYVHYLLRSRAFQEEYYRHGSGIVADLWSTRWPAMKQIRLALPPAIEQQGIAKFLDRETAEIDAFIADQEELIALLTERRVSTISHAVTKGLDPSALMKDSGIDWVGEVPASWEVTRMKNIGNIRYGLGEPPEYVDDGVPLIRATNVDRGVIAVNGLVFVDPATIPAQRILWLERGDIIVVRSGALTGDSAIIRDGYVGSIAGFDMVLRPAPSVNAEFIQFCLLSTYVKSAQLDTAQARAAQPHLNAMQLGGVILCLPERNEQDAIASHLSQETTEIDATITDAREAIALSKERRAALISAAVTGKIDVRNHGEVE